MKEILPLVYNSWNPLPNYYKLGRAELNEVIKTLCEQKIDHSLRILSGEQSVLDITDTKITVRLMKVYKGYWLGLLTIVDTNDTFYVRTFLSAEEVIDYLKDRDVLS